MRSEMHAHADLLSDLKYSDFIPEEVMFKWFNDAYSTSKHLLTLYSIAIGLKAQTILEIGFGRSSFVLAKAAHINKGKLHTCDNRDFRYLLNSKEFKVTNYLLGNSSEVWKNPELQNTGIDFAFLDYFSNDTLSEMFIRAEVNKCISLLKQNGVICIHDTVNKYKLSGMNFNVSGETEAVSLPFNYGLTVIRRINSSVYGTITSSWNIKQE